MMSGYSRRLRDHADCTGYWRWSCWTALFRWFGLLRLEVQYDMGGGVLNYRRANTHEWQRIVSGEPTHDSESMERD